MTIPNDDPWADLYKDLGLPGGESAARPAPAEPPPVEEFIAAEPEEEPIATVEEEDLVEVLEDGTEAAVELEEEGALAGEGEEETGPKKRRRRRRRRKKKGAGEPAEAGPAAAAEGPEAEETAGEFEGPEEEEEVEAGFGDEGVSPEATRDLIANWNVPSWSEIVAGLYRPERG
jgi:ribonuclease E